MRGDALMDPHPRSSEARSAASKEALTVIKDLDAYDQKFVLAYLAMNHPGSVEKALAALEMNDLLQKEATELLK